MNVVFAYITARDAEEACRIGRALVEERLAACANILPAMESIYRWKGALEEAREAVLIAKTRSHLQDHVIQRVIELHSYENPCVVFLPVAGGAAGYLEWIAGETEDP